ncbi:Choline dehydrogenase [Wallemia ichthyophaga EXF-994]|uniref:Choline dehydrogenase n=1 Tax=Wallemia ichthyophaga (strain EXF-994 / CBS 113033) TaxID=1299270 RepID=R9AAM3_WALI9|nr:Choline dehydrogenase [Wallemia ichthyophaga EXF-994]EOQ99109.1 Choline dehydrogenase [Wallemia ichthyophaga EXF-994]
MKLQISSLLLASLASSTLAAYNPHSQHKHWLTSRADTSDDVSKVNNKDFDFIVVGGGVGGLAVAARISENENLTVAVIEAGGDGSEHEDQIYIPGYSYLNGLTVSDYDWNYKVVQQQVINGNDQTFGSRWPRGKGLGGSGAINGLFWCRASSDEYNAWNTLNPDSRIDWGWEEMQKYMKKSETLHKPSQEHIDTFNINFDEEYHGTDGPIQVGWPYYIYDPVKHWIPAYDSLGINIPEDGASGNNHGPVITTSTINPSNMSRSDPKAGYIDPLPPRPNLTILTNHQVTTVDFSDEKDADGNLVANGVYFGKTDGSTDSNDYFRATANKEVILSGGTVNTPQTLQLSGIGPEDLLQQYDIEVKNALPGVGHNLQDHAATSVYFNTNVAETWYELKDDQTAAVELEKWRNDDGKSKWSYVNQAIAYPDANDIMSDQLDNFSSNIQNNIDEYADSVKNMYNEDDTVIAGMREQWNITHGYLDKEVGQLEMLMTMLGGGPGEIGFQLAIQHPFSRGVIEIQSKDPFTHPAIDPGYLTHSADMEIMRQGVRFAIELSKAGEMGDYITKQENYNNNTDEAIDMAIRNDAHTEYHPLGTAAMLPLNKGGVVNTSLIVYGTSNLRVVDSSIIPIEISAHLMATTYGIAEKAADIIKTHYSQDDPDERNKQGSSSSEEGDGDSGANKKGIAIGVVVGIVGLATIGAVAWAVRRNMKKRAWAHSMAVSTGRGVEAEGEGSPTWGYKEGSSANLTGGVGAGGLAAAGAGAGAVAVTSQSDDTLSPSRPSFHSYDGFDGGAGVAVSDLLTNGHGYGVVPQHDFSRSISSIERAEQAQAQAQAQAHTHAQDEYQQTPSLSSTHDVHTTPLFKQ